jgi:uncharacterized protein YjbJ (UPF0337 family)
MASDIPPNERADNGHWAEVRKSRPEEGTMGFVDKIKNKLQMGKGRAKESAGRKADDPYLAGEGRADRVAGGAKQVGEQVKDAGRAAGGRKTGRTFE